MEFNPEYQWPLVCSQMKFTSSSRSSNKVTPTALRMVHDFALGVVRVEDFDDPTRTLETIKLSDVVGSEITIDPKGRRLTVYSYPSTAQLRDVKKGISPKHRKRKDLHYSFEADSPQFPEDWAVSIVKAIRTLSTGNAEGQASSQFLVLRQPILRD
jgi:hypothetical protein